MTTRVALVTGASRGIGAAIGEALLEAGFSVVGISRRIQKGSAAQTTVPSSYLAMTCDVTVEAEVSRLIKEIDARYGRLDMVVNNAGIGYVEPLAETPLDHWKSTLDVNLTGAFLVSQYAIPLLRKSGQGHIFNMASVAGRKGFAGWGAYSASKFGLLGLTEVLREELRSDGVKVTAVIAGATDTPFWDVLQTGFDRSRMIPAKDVAKAILEAYAHSDTCSVDEIVLKPARGDF